MEKFKFVIIILVLHFFYECIATEAVIFCDRNTRFRRSVPYIISIGDCDPSNIKILQPDDNNGEVKEDDMVQAAASNVEDVAGRVMEGRKTFYGLLIKVLTHFKGRADGAVAKARRMVEDKGRSLG